jgi:predicted nucleotidyltransferase
MNRMDKANVLKRLQQNQSLLTTFDVDSLMLFGSVARSQATESSDIDFVVTFKSSATFDKYMELKLFLEDLLERRVDLVTADAIRAQLKPSIEQDAIYVA